MLFQKGNIVQQKEEIGPDEALGIRREKGEPAAVWAPLEDAKEWADNPRVNDHAVPGVVRSIKRFGFGAVLIVRQGELVAGHTRVKGCFELVREWAEADDVQRKAWVTSKDPRTWWHPDAVAIASHKVVPIRFRDDLPESEAHLLAVADNRTGEAAHWDDKGLAKVMSSYAPVDIEFTGFDPGEIPTLEDESGDSGPGEINPNVPSVPKNPRTKVGDIWELGRHRLVCGDSKVGAALKAALRDSVADMVLTDPPYGVDYVGKTKEKLPVHNDGKEGLLGLLTKCLNLVSDLCRPGGSWYVCAPAGPNFLEFGLVLKELGIWRQTLVWVKSVLVMGRSDYHYRHEAIFYGWKPGAAHKPPPDRKQDTVWEFPKPSASKDHPTTKPPALFEKAVLNSSRHNDLVCDPFSGSGTTLLVCEKTGRRAACVEFSPGYCDVIIRRWEEYTGQKAELVGSLQEGGDGS